MKYILLRQNAPLRTSSSLRSWAPPKWLSWKSPSTLHRWSFRRGSGRLCRSWRRGRAHTRCRSTGRAPRRTGGSVPGLPARCPSRRCTAWSTATRISCTRSRQVDLGRAYLVVSEFEEVRLFFCLCSRSSCALRARFFAKEWAHGNTFSASLS